MGVSLRKEKNVVKIIKQIAIIIAILTVEIVISGLDSIVRLIFYGKEL